MISRQEKNKAYRARTQRFSDLWNATFILLIVGVALTASADQLDDDFNSGLDLNRWVVHSNQPLFSWDDSSGDILLSKPAGGTGVGVEYIDLVLSRGVKGNFDVQVEFSGASLGFVNGIVGNQAQLETIFGSQQFVVVRSDESGVGDNAHIFANPPGAWFGSIPTAETSGTLRITRVGTTVTGYFNGSQLFQSNYNGQSVTFIALQLQNNETTDAISVRFDNFSLTADVIGIFSDGFESGNLSAWSNSSP